MPEVEVRNVNNQKLTFLTVLINLPNRQKKVTLPLGGVKSGFGVNNSTETTSKQFAETQATKVGIVNKNVSPSALEMQILQTADPLLVENAIDQSVAAYDSLWTACNPESLLNKCMQMHQCKKAGPSGNFISPRHAFFKMTSLDFFMWMFPM